MRDTCVEGDLPLLLQMVVNLKHDVVVQFASDVKLGKLPKDVLEFLVRDLLALIVGLEDFEEFVH